MLKDKTERIQILKQIDRIQDTECKKCKHNRKAGKWCAANCDFGQQLAQYGQMLGASEKPKKKETQKVANKLKVTKESYMQLHNEGLSDKEISWKFDISIATLYSYKSKWGLSKKRQSSDKNLEDTTKMIAHWKTKYQEAVNDAHNHGEKYAEAVKNFEDVFKEKESLKEDYITLAKERDKLKGLVKNLEDFKVNARTKESAYEQLELQLDDALRNFDELKEKYRVVSKALKLLL
jgi:chromosome segregation ATPase